MKTNSAHPCDAALPADSVLGTAACMQAEQPKQSSCSHCPKRAPLKPEHALLLHSATAVPCHHVASLSSGRFKPSLPLLISFASDDTTLFRVLVPLATRPLRPLLRPASHFESDSTLDSSRLAAPLRRCLLRQCSLQEKELSMPHRLAATLASTRLLRCALLFKRRQSQPPSDMPGWTCIRSTTNTR